MTSRARSLLTASILAFVFAASLLMLSPARAAVCAADLDGDFAVGTTDLLQLLAEWGPCVGCPSDSNGDDIVDVVDLLALLSGWGPCLFECPVPFADSEIQQIGLEALGPGGGLTLSPAIYERIEHDVLTIRADFGLEGYIHTCRWVSREMLVGIDPDGPLENYEALNTYYGATVLNSWFGGTIVHLGFECDMNMPALGAIYEAESEVNYAEQNGIVGGASQWWTPTALTEDLWQWTVIVGFWDCFDGCDCTKTFTFVTDSDGTVTQTGETPVVGPSYCPDEIPGPPDPDVVESWEVLCNY